MRAGAVVLLVALATLDPAVGCGASTALEASSGPPRPAPAIRVALRLRPVGSISAIAVAIARRETRDLWKPAGVDVVGEQEDADATLRVVWTRVLPQPGGARTSSLAGVRFSGGRPEPMIRVWDEAIVAAAQSGVRPQIAGNDTIGRVLGRVLAHEIGHYLHGTPGHARSGLMRARHSAAEFAAESRTPFEPGEWNVRTAEPAAPPLDQ